MPTKLLSAIESIDDGTKKNKSFSVGDKVMVCRENLIPGNVKPIVSTKRLIGLYFDVKSVSLTINSTTPYYQLNTKSLQFDHVWISHKSLIKVDENYLPVGFIYDPRYAPCVICGVDFDLSVLTACCNECYEKDPSLSSNIHSLVKKQGYTCWDELLRKEQAQDIRSMLADISSKSVTEAVTVPVIPAHIKPGIYIRPGVHELIKESKESKGYKALLEIHADSHLDEYKKMLESNDDVAKKEKEMKSKSTDKSEFEFNINCNEFIKKYLSTPTLKAEPVMVHSFCQAICLLEDDRLMISETPLGENWKEDEVNTFFKYEHPIRHVDVYNHMLTFMHGKDKVLYYLPDTVFLKELKPLVDKSNVYLVGWVRFIRPSSFFKDINSFNWENRTKDSYDYYCPSRLPLQGDWPTDGHPKR